MITWAKTFLPRVWLHEIYFRRRIILWKVLFWGWGQEKLIFGRSLWGCSSIFAKSFQCISFFFSLCDGFTWDSRAWIFSSSSLILSSFFWDSAWASCRALNSSSNYRGKKESLLFVCAHVRNACKHTEGGSQAAWCLHTNGCGAHQQAPEPHHLALWPPSIHSTSGPQACSSLVFVSSLGFHVGWWI